MAPTKPKKAVGRPKGPAKTATKKPTKGAAKVSSKAAGKTKAKAAAKLLVKSAAKSLKAAAAKPTNKTKKAKAKVVKKPVGRPVTKSRTAPAKKSPTKAPAKSPAKVQTKSPVRKPAKSPKQIAKSPARAPANARTPAKSPGRTPAKLPARSPAKVSTKVMKRSPKQPAAKLAKSPGVKKTPVKVAKKPTPRKTPRAAVRTPVKAKVSPKKTPAKATLKKAVTPKSPRSATKRALPVKKETTPAKKTGGSLARIAGRRSVTPKKVPVKVQKHVSSPRSASKVVPVSKPKPKVVTPAAKKLPSNRKRTAAATPPKESPVKKSKPDVKPVSRNLAKDMGLPLQSPPRPTRIISPPARLLDAAPSPEKRASTGAQQRGSPVKGKQETSPLLKSPPKPTRVVAKAVTRPSRADMTTRRDSAGKVPEPAKVAARGTKRAASAPAVVAPASPAKGTVKKVAQVKQQVSKSADRQETRTTERQGTRSSERSAGKPAQGSQKKETVKTTRSPVKVASPKRDDQKTQTQVAPVKGKVVQSPTRRGQAPEKSPAVVEKPKDQAVSHPCTHCGLVFRSRSDAELHEHRCNKNPSRSDKRYPCKQCSGMFTMTDLILHKKQAHPQREPSTSNSPAPSPGNTEKAQPVDPKKSTSSGGGGIVVKVPVGGELGDVIRQAIQAATTAGIVPANKRVVVSGPNVKSSVVTGKKQKEKAPVETSSPPPTFPPTLKHIKTSKASGRVAVVSPAIQTIAGKRVIHLSSKSMLSPDKADSPPKFFTCLDCGDIFPSRKKVSEHKEECPGVGKTSVQSCMECNQTFATRNELNAHKKATHVKSAKPSGMTVRGYKCSKCELFFPVDSEVKKHIREFHPDEEASSIMCNVVATPDALPSGDFRRNISQEMVEEVIQNIVNGVRNGKGPDGTTQNATDSSTATPTTSNTSTPDTTPLPSPSSRSPGQCLDCFMKVSSRLELAKHKRSCEKALQNRQLFCFDCGKPFRSYIDLNRHKQEEHGKESRMLKCTQCNLFFKSNPEWLSHQKSCHQRVSFGKKTTADWGSKTTTSQQAKIAAANKALAQAPSKTSTPESPESTKKGRPARGTRTNTQKDKGPANKQKSGVDTAQSEGIEEIKTTRSGRIVRKRRQDDEEFDEMITRAVKGKGKTVRFSDSPQAIGTIEFVQQEDSSDLKEEPSEDEVEEVVPETAPPAKRARTQRSASPKTAKAASGSESKDGKDDERTSISLANGLVTISADKANDYQIFVDAKKDGSSIQVKLVRNEDTAKRPSASTSTVTPKKALPAKTTRQSPSKRESPRPVQRKAQTEKQAVAQKEVPKPTSAKSAKSPAAPAAAASNVQANRKGNQSASTAKAPTRAAEDAPAKDTGKVVQKGKPFVIGGQTLVPIQLPPGFQLPGGSTGGQKVFAIPSTNLPPGLLQLLARQNKASAPPPPPAKPTKPTKPQPPAASKKKPAILRSSPTKSPKTGASTGPELPPSLKGMTGAQLMARAQAKILGRPLPQVKVPTPPAPTPPVKNPAPAAAIDARASQYNDPLFVYQCTSCNANFKSTFDVKSHMRTCIVGLSPRAKRQRLAAQKKEQQKQSTDVWHIKPVARTSDQDAAAGQEDVEWFVASSKS